MQDQHFKEGTNFALRYKIVKLLGSGGMGEVYLVEDAILNNELQALKVLKSKLLDDEKQVKRFLQEVQLTRKVQSENVVKTYEVNKVDDYLYFTMEYIEGETLRDVLSKRTLSIDETIEILLGVCNGLNAIHEQQIIHRDLKPANIIITKNGSVKIADFGVARNHKSDLTAIDEVVGSSLYMSPEVWTGKDITPQADIYSLGVLVYELLTGIVPFDGETSAEIMYKHLKGNPTAPNQINEEIPVWLSKLTLKMIATSLDKRAESAVYILDEIKFSLENNIESDSLRQDELIEPILKPVLIKSKEHNKFVLDPSFSKNISAFKESEKRVVNPEFGTKNLESIKKNEKAITKIISKTIENSNSIKFVLNLFAILIIAYLILVPLGDLLRHILMGLVVKNKASFGINFLTYIVNISLFSIVYALPFYLISSFYKNTGDAIFLSFKIALFFMLATLLLTGYYSILLGEVWREFNDRFDYLAYIVYINKSAYNALQNIFEIVLLVPEGTFYKAVVKRGIPDFIEVNFSSYKNIIVYYIFLILTLFVFLTILKKYLFNKKFYNMSYTLIIIPILFLIWTFELALSNQLNSGEQIIITLISYEFRFDYYWLICSLINWTFLILYTTFGLARIHRPKKVLNNIFSRLH